MIFKNEEELAKANLSNSQLHKDIVFEFEVNMPNLMICTTGNVYFKAHAIVKSIEAGRFIEAGGFIKTGESIEAGGFYQDREVYRSRRFYQDREVYQDRGVCL